LVETFDHGVVVISDDHFALIVDGIQGYFRGIEQAQYERVDLVFGSVGFVFGVFFNFYQIFNSLDYFLFEAEKDRLANNIRQDV
jgi:hypothetical protein